jgi:O-methyltransferase
VSLARAPRTTHEDMGADFHALRERVAPYTMTSPERQFALHEAARYVVAAAVPGDFVECGVWRGGSSMMVALTLDALSERRRMWLYDTFDGMPTPSPADRLWTGHSATSELDKATKAEGVGNVWAYATLDDVKENMGRTGYPPDLITYIAGRVEDTIPAQAPDQIALLRLDTDWYESTRHELEHLWDRLVPGGVMILDDYGHWQGARKAVDEFFAGRPQLLARVDYTGRMTVKLPET